ncbi:MAG: DUF2202 domain-containing protein [Bacteroidetes bacterium]|nr:DUF2202 domain-containing protein [Bacteroidota bacterium]
MKNWMLISVAFLSLAFLGCEKEDLPDVNTLSQQEIDDLQFLREEEKLARDVYQFSNELYDEMIFANISNSEQKHMDEVLGLLEKYDIEDPASTEVGKFNNPNLQNLYDQLTDQASNSLLDALIVGATIEDLDINDLKTNVANTDRSDLLAVYEMLQCGSRNHLRGYTSWIDNNGGSYAPQYIDQAEYDEILAGEHEHCGR